MEFLVRSLQENVTEAIATVTPFITSNNSSSDIVANGVWFNSTDEFMTSASSSSSQSSSDGTLSSMLACASWLLLAFYCCCTRRRGATTEQGDRIRRLAREAWEREQRQKERQEQTPEQRKQVVELSLRNKRVISKDAKGNLQLGPTLPPSDNATSSASNTPATLPVNQSTSYEEDYEYGDDNDDEEQACVICLEPFEVDDVVSWSRHSKTCHHVFHTECIEPWLLERRQDDCPSCRSKLIVFDYQDSERPVKENLENVLSMSFDEEDEQQQEEDDSIFMIVHGMISQVARQAVNSTYTLVGTQDSMEDEDHDNDYDGDDGSHRGNNDGPDQGGDKTNTPGTPATVNLSTPSPLRRVMSHEPARTPERTLSGSFRNLFFSSKRKLFADYYFNDTDYGRIPKHDDDEEDGDDRAVVNSHNNNNNNNWDLESQTNIIMARPIPFRRVVSEGIASPSRPVGIVVQADSMSTTTTTAPETTIGESLRTPPTLRRRSSSSSFLRMRRSNSYLMRHHHDIAADDQSDASSNIIMAMDDEEDDLEWRLTSPISITSPIRLADIGEMTTSLPPLVIPDDMTPMPGCDDNEDEENNKNIV